MKKWYFLPISALLIFGGLVGCSSGGEGGPVAPSSTEQPGAIDPPPQEGAGTSGQ